MQSQTARVVAIVEQEIGDIHGLKVLFGVDFPILYSLETDETDYMVYVLVSKRIQPELEFILFKVHKGDADAVMCGEIGIAKVIKENEEVFHYRYLRERKGKGQGFKAEVETKGYGSPIGENRWVSKIPSEGFRIPAVFPNKYKRGGIVG